MVGALLFSSSLIMQGRASLESQPEAKSAGPQTVLLITSLCLSRIMGC